MRNENSGDGMVARRDTGMETRLVDHSFLVKSLLSSFLFTWRRSQLLGRARVWARVCIANRFPFVSHFWVGSVVTHFRFGK
jgi:hypothetical protein